VQCTETHKSKTQKCRPTDVRGSQSMTHELLPRVRVRIRVRVRVRVRIRVSTSCCCGAQGCVRVGSAVHGDKPTGGRAWWRGCGGRCRRNSCSRPSPQVGKWVGGWGQRAKAQASRLGARRAVRPPPLPSTSPPPRPGGTERSSLAWPGLAWPDLPWWPGLAWRGVALACGVSLAA